MQSQPGNQWANGYAGVDCTWNRTGFSAPHGGVAFKALGKNEGAVIGAEAISRINPDNPCCVSSSSFERMGVAKGAAALADQGFGEESCKIAIDNDVKTLKELKKRWERLWPLICSGISSCTCMCVHTNHLFVINHTHRTSEQESWKFSY